MANISNLTRGIIKENPTFVLLLGMCPTLGVTTSGTNGLGMGLATMFVLIMSNGAISLLKNLIPDKVRIPGFIVIIATFVTILQFLMEAYVPALYKQLGLYIPLIVVNCIILGRAESYASKNGPIESIFDGIGMGLGFTFGLACIGIVREFIGTGAIFGKQILPLADLAAGQGGYVPVTIFILPPGAFLGLAFLVAGMNRIRKNAEKKGKKIAEPQGCCSDCAGCAGCSGKVFPTGDEE